MVVETKSTAKLDAPRLDECYKTYCGAAHFGSTQPPIGHNGALLDIGYRAVIPTDALPCSR